jgi:hypothetical protein
MSRTQYGAVTAGPAVLVLTPPVAVRRWKAVPLPGVAIIMACADPAASVSRIMTPALIQAFVFCSLATRAMMSPSPLSG